VASTLRWDGLEEFTRELRNLPADLAEEAGAIVVAAAEGAKTEIVARYEAHSFSGNLASHVKMDRVDAGEFGASARVRSTAKHAHIFEIGTVARHTSTGADRGISPSGGSEPPAQIFVPAAIRHRRRMYERLKALLVTHGATVTGEP
jgi:hypothetical protein